MMCRGTLMPNLSRALVAMSWASARDFASRMSSRTLIASISSICFLLLTETAFGQVIGNSPAPAKLVLYSATTQGNGADTTEDTLAGYSGTVQFANVGDSIHFVARGVSAGSTDVKTIRLKLGASTACSNTNSTAGQTVWYLECWVTKSGTNAQSTAFWSNNATNNTLQNVNATAVNDGSPITVSVTAQDATTATANAIQITMGLATYIPAQ